MITRAYRKNMVIIRDIESDIVEEAYLFIREDSYEPPEEDIVREAGKIIRACSRGHKRSLKIPSALLWFLGGMAFAGTALMFLFIL